MFLSNFGDDLEFYLNPTPGYFDVKKLCFYYHTLV